MCGIWALFNSTTPVDISSQIEWHNEFAKIEQVEDNFKKGKCRGPEYSTMNYDYREYNVFLGFHRLAINGLDVKSNQPLIVDKIVLICNGEIYNYKKLYEMMDVEPTTGSDCEVIIHMYKKYGIRQTLIMLDGVFGFVLFDITTNSAYAGRDPYGVRPLYISGDTNGSSFMIASEMKMLTSPTKTPSQVISIEPGHFLSFKSNIAPEAHIPLWRANGTPEKYISEPCINYTRQGDIDAVLDSIYSTLSRAVEKRVVGTTERPIACLLSGGLDSSLISALVNKYYDKQIETYSIGMPGGEDTKWAKKVAEHLGSKHTSIELSEDDFFNAIPEVIRVIESYDTTTVRASVGNYLVAKYIKEHSEAKVIFNGDGSDELCGGYLYFHSAPDAIEFDRECRRLLKDIHYFDVLRSDRCIAGNGLEPRTPFLDRAWVQHYLSIPCDIRYHPGNKQCEKWLLRKAFDRDNILPREVLWRTKEAFSDGVSSQERSWFEIIEEKIPQKYKDEFAKFNNDGTITKYVHNTPKTNEQYYYRVLFEESIDQSQNPVKNRAENIPYFWLPRFTDATDASARTLDIYKKLGQSEKKWDILE